MYVTPTFLNKRHYVPVHTHMHPTKQASRTYVCADALMCPNRAHRTCGKADNIDMAANWEEAGQ